MHTWIYNSSLLLEIWNRLLWCCHRRLFGLFTRWGIANSLSPILAGIYSHSPLLDSSQIYGSFRGRDQCYTLLLHFPSLDPLNQTLIGKIYIWDIKSNHKLYSCVCVWCVFLRKAPLCLVVRVGYGCRTICVILLAIVEKHFSKLLWTFHTTCNLSGDS